MGTNGFDGKSTDITELLRELLERESYTGPIVIIASDGEEPSQNDRFLELLKEFDIHIVGATPRDDLFRDFADIDSIRRMLILGDRDDTSDSVDPR